METPPVIIDVPLPILGTQTPNDNSIATYGHSSSLESGAGIRPTTIPDASISSAPTAKEVISSSLDTSIRKILGAFTFGKVGAIQVGQYSQGVSGQIAISPNGIIGEDDQGVSRFVLDTDGTLTLRTDNNTAIFDGSGIISLSTFPGGQLANLSPALTTASLVPLDVPGSNIGSITNSRIIKVLFFLNAEVWNDSAITSDLNDYANVDFYDSFGAAPILNVFSQGITSTRFTGGGGATQSVGSTLVSQTVILNVDPGTHNYKLRYSATNGGTAHIDYWDFGFLVLGS